MIITLESTGFGSTLLPPKTVTFNLDEVFGVIHNKERNSVRFLNKDNHLMNVPDIYGLEPEEIDWLKREITEREDEPDKGWGDLAITVYQFRQEMCIDPALVYHVHYDKLEKTLTLYGADEKVLPHGVIRNLSYEYYLEVVRLLKLAIKRRMDQ